MKNYSPNEKKDKDPWVDLIKNKMSSGSIIVSTKEKNEGNGRNPGNI